MQTNNFEDRFSKTKKVIVLIVLVCIVFFIYTYRLFMLQIVNGDHYRSQSKEISSHVSELPAQRGEIFDRSANLPMVINTDSFAVEVIPGDIPRERYDTVIMKLANFLGVSKNELDEKINISKNRKSFTPIQVKTNVPFTVISNIAENKTDLPGVTWVSKPVRNYLHTQSLSHIVGYVGPIEEEEFTEKFNQGYTKNSIVGKTGIEKQYDSLLQGAPGHEMYTVDVHGRIISDKPKIEPPEMGKSLVLTIDSRIQKLVEDTISDHVGAMVVLKPATGEVLAMVSYPYFDSNLFNSDNSAEEYAKLSNDSRLPLINRAVQSEYPPASTFKIVMSTAMLQERAFPKDKKIECKGEMEYGGNTFHCHVKTGHGWLDLKNGFAQSCDVYYWTIGRDYLGIEKIASYAREFGFGESAQIDLPDQKIGLVPTAEWKKKKYNQNWLGGDTMSCSIGQGYMLVTPLQMANMGAMVSNAGVIYKPHILKEVRDPVSGEVLETVEPEVLKESTIDKSVWKDVQYLMRYCITNGTPVYSMHNELVQIACKTGTAQVTGYEDSWHSWLIAYAPYDAPPEDRVCVATVIEACNPWEWYAPYATDIVIQGIFGNQTFEEAYKELGFQWVMQNHEKNMKDLAKNKKTSNAGARQE